MRILCNYVLPLAVTAGCCLLAGCAAITTPAATIQEAKRDAYLEKEGSAIEQKRDDAQMAAARDRADQGDVDAAEKLLEALLERNPNHTDARLLLADLWVAQNRTAQAEEQLRRVLKNHPENARAHFSLGLLCEVSERNDEAAEHFRQALELAPDDATYRLSAAPATPTK